MLVSFTPNYNVNNKVNAGAVNFNGANLYRTSSQVFDAIKELSTLSPFQKQMKLNTIAVAVKNNPELADKRYVKLAMNYMPAEDDKHNATKYAIELIRLAKYSNMTDKELEVIEQALKSRKFTNSLDYSLENFKTKTTNKYGMYVNERPRRKITRIFPNTSSNKYGS